MCGKFSTNHKLIFAVTIIATLTLSSCATNVVNSNTQFLQVLADKIYLTGTITKDYTKNGIANAEINLISKDKIYRTYSDNKGNFVISIPKNLFKKTVLLSINYKNIVREKSERLFQSQENILVPIVDLNTQINIKFHNYLRMGGLEIGEKSERFYINGRKVSEKEYKKTDKAEGMIIYLDDEKEISSIFKSRVAGGIRMYFSDHFIVKQ